jgi:hypothetical protein
MPVNASDFGHKNIPKPVDPARVQRVLLILQDVVTLAIFVFSIVGPSVRPIFALGYCFSIREVLVAMGGQVSPAASLWDLNLVSFFGTKSNEQSISAAVMVFTVFVFEAKKALPKRGKWTLLVSLPALGFACYALVSLRAVWTTNILLGAFIARYATLVAKIQDPFVEGLLP